LVRRHGFAEPVLAAGGTVIPPPELFAEVDELVKCVVVG